MATKQELSEAYQHLWDLVQLASEHWDHEWGHPEEILRAEIDRLRSALEKIAGHADDWELCAEQAREFAKDARESLRDPDSATGDTRGD